MLLGTDAGKAGAEQGWGGNQGRPEEEGDASSERDETGAPSLHDSHQVAEVLRQDR